MKIKTKDFYGIKDKSGNPITCCGDMTLYQLNGWDKKDWLCADCFLNELIQSEAEYQVISKQTLKEINIYKKAYNLLMDYWDSLPDEEKPEIHKKLNRLGL